MARNESIEGEKPLGLPLHPPLTVGIAIDGKTNSKYLVNWALDKFIPEEYVAFKLLHVRPVITSVPTPSNPFKIFDVGNSIPISQVREDVAAAYRKEIEWQTSQMLRPFHNVCIRRKVQVDVIVIESNDVVGAIQEEVTKSNIKKLVIGVAPRGLFSRKMRGSTLSSRISKSVPNLCTVYAVSKGKLISIRPSDEETNGSTRDDDSVSNSSTGDSSSQTFSTQSGTDFASVDSFSSQPLHLQQFQALSAINNGLNHARTSSIDINYTNLQHQDESFSSTREYVDQTSTNSIQTSHSRHHSLDTDDRNYAESSCPSTSDVQHTLSRSSSCKSSQIDHHESSVSDQASTSDLASEFCLSDGPENIKFELEKLRIELRHIRGMYAVAQSEAMDASRKLTDMNKRHNEEATKLREIEQRRDLAYKLALKEKERREAAMKEAEYIKQCAEREASEREEAELLAIRDAKEKRKLESALEGSIEQYQKYTWQEIETATSSFSEELKIGMGAYGTVYKCELHHTTAAVKVLHSKENSNSKQFQKEIEILSKVRHPHLLILLGACPEKGCLIYEYMENGSLEDRLLRSNNTPPIPWFKRFQIAWEVASALAFLHHTKPKPIVHRDLKPANILLDHNLVSKIGDVGLSTILQSDASYAATMQADTGPVGTLCYIDPEYQRTGLISPKSDVYAFGMVILQLLTAKPAIALTHKVESAIEDGRLLEILDPEAGNWPIEESKELALLGLKCAELRRRDRPDLKDEVLPVLERLKHVADKTRGAVSGFQRTPPSHFMCPILKDVMLEPSVAADGYTYEREAIEKWMEEHEKSPMTNLPLPNKNLVPNYTLLSAIMEWKSHNQ